MKKKKGLQRGIKGVVLLGGGLWEENSPDCFEFHLEKNTNTVGNKTLGFMSPRIIAKLFCTAS